MAQTLSIILSCNLEQPSFTNHLGWEVRDVVVVDEAVNSHEVKWTLFKEETFVSTADHHFAGKDEVEGITGYSSYEDSWVNQVIQIFIVKKVHILRQFIYFVLNKRFVHVIRITAFHVILLIQASSHVIMGNDAINLVNWVFIGDDTTITKRIVNIYLDIGKLSFFISGTLSIRNSLRDKFLGFEFIFYIFERFNLFI